MEEKKTIQLSDGKTAYLWTTKEKPSINHWYRLKYQADYWKIKKDFYCEANKTTYYKIIEYYNGDVLYTYHSLARIREIMRENTYRMVI